MRLAIGICSVLLTLLFVSLAPSRADDQFDIISHEHPSSNIDIVHIRQPNVKVAVQPYPSIAFQPGDEIVVEAAGCVQTGGTGDTWKRYVHPTGDDSDKYYFGEIWIPGLTQLMQPIEGVIGRALYVPLGASTNNLYLRLGYSDDNLSDNGYYAHDNGTENQCAGVGPAEVTLTITHNAVHQPPTSEVAPFDLFWDQVDQNWIPYQAVWGESINHQLNPADHPTALPGDDICATPWLSPCTTQAPSIDMASWPNTWLSCDHLGGPLTGHANWGPGTYQGTLQWESKSAAGADDDYSLNLTTLDNAGATAGRAQGFHIEFDSDETVDNFGSKWWKFVQDSVDVGDAEATDLFRDRFAIVSGLIDLDCAHPCSGELHPVYALFVRVDNNQSDQRWGFFVRNWGNEGGCASDDHQLLLDGNRYVVRLPWVEGATSVRIGDTDIATNSDAVSITELAASPGIGVELAFQLPSPDSRASVDGAFQLLWSMPPGRPPRPTLPVVRAPLSIARSGLMVSRGLMVALPFGGVRDEMLPPMTASQRSAFLAHLPPVSRHPSKKHLKPGPIRMLTAVEWRAGRNRAVMAKRAVPLIRSVADFTKGTRDLARFRALEAAFGGSIPGQASRMSPGIGGATLNPPPHPRR
jgi:hypothetical protein